jgi:hypothetical protein
MHTDRHTQRALDRIIETNPDLMLAFNLGYAVAAHKVTKTTRSSCR